MIRLAALGHVVGRDVPADADAFLAVQPAFALPLAARVLKHVDPATGIAVAKDHVGNKLLEAGVFLDLVPRPIAGVLGGK